MGGMKRGEEADLGHRNKPRADTGSRRFLHRDFPGCKHSGRTPVQPVSPGLSRACASCRDRHAASAGMRCGAPSTRHSLHQPLLPQTWLAAVAGSRASSATARHSPARQCNGSTETALCIPSVSIPEGCHLHPPPPDLTARMGTQPRLSEQAPESRAREANVGCPQAAVAPAGAGPVCSPRAAPSHSLTQGISMLLGMVVS